MVDLIGLANELLAHYKGRIYFYKKEIDEVTHYAVIDGDGKFVMGFPQEDLILAMNEFTEKHVKPSFARGKQVDYPEEFESLNCEPRRLGVNGMVSVCYL